MVISDAVSPWSSLSLVVRASYTLLSCKSRNISTYLLLLPWEWWWCVGLLLVGVAWYSSTVSLVSLVTFDVMLGGTISAIDAMVESGPAVDFCRMLWSLVWSFGTYAHNRAFMAGTQAAITVRQHSRSEGVEAKHCARVQSASSLSHFCIWMTRYIQAAQALKFLRIRVSGFYFAFPPRVRLEKYKERSGNLQCSQGEQPCNHPLLSPSQFELPYYFQR